MRQIRRTKVKTEATAAFQQAVEERAEVLSREAWNRVADLEVLLQDARHDIKELEYRLERFQSRLPKKKSEPKYKSMTVRGEAPPPGAVVTLEEIPNAEVLVREAEERGPELEVDIVYTDEAEVDHDFVVAGAPTRRRRRRRARPT